MTTTTRLIASLALFLAAACGSSQQPTQAAVPAPARKLTSLADHQCDDAPPPPAATADDTGGMCSAE